VQRLWRQQFLQTQNCGGSSICVLRRYSQIWLPHTLSAAPPPLVLAEASTTADFTPTSLSVVLAEAAAAAGSTRAPLLLLHAEAAAAAEFTLAPQPLMLTEARTAAVFAHLLAPPMLPLARRCKQGRT